MSRRHLSSSLFCLLLAASGGAAAYGLGEARVLSALGEPLRVSLPVKLSPGTGLDASCLQIAAPPGRETPFIADLLRAQFRVTEVGDGLAEVLITTRRPWTEPILVFPLRVGCGAGGATYREITLLIDPPNLVVPSAPVAAAPAAPQPPA
ncbi:MAG TPA: hypothetical protein VIX81_05210, partial [Gammaproteobacteria bacterium]